VQKWVALSPVSMEFYEKFHCIKYADVTKKVNVRVSWDVGIVSSPWNSTNTIIYGAFCLLFIGQPGPRVQASGVWLSALPLEPGSPDAFCPPLPASLETLELAVSAEPGSADATVSPTNDVLVYN
jgi:hypothetical protein